MSVKSALAVCVLLAALGGASCAPMTANRGHMVDPDRMATLKVGESTREQVLDQLGSPSHTASFDENTWYYVGRRTEQYSFLNPSVVEQQVVTIRFDDNGVVKSIDKNDGKDEIREVDTVSRKTPSYGRETTLLQDLFGNIGRPGGPVGNKGGK